MPGGIEGIRRQKEELGKMTFTEWVALIVFGLAILLWATESIHKHKMAVVTLGVVMLLFIPGLTNLLEKVSPTPSGAHGCCCAALFPWSAHLKKPGWKNGMPLIVKTHNK